MTPERADVPVKGFIPTTMIDWEGRLSAVLFLPRCNLRCPYCHGADFVERADRMPDVPPGLIEEKLRALGGWIDGCVISGGEPTIHARLPATIDWLRSMAPAIKLDTNGTNPRMLEDLIKTGRLDYGAMDVKAPLDERYSAAAGTPLAAGGLLEKIAESIEILKTSGIEYEFRTTLCPEFLGKNDVADIARTLAGARRYILQQFRPVGCLDPAMERVKPYTEGELREILGECRRFVADCVLRGDPERSNVVTQGALNF